MDRFKFKVPLLRYPSLLLLLFSLSTLSLLGIAWAESTGEH